jgi:hypothetical protein
LILRIIPTHPEVCEIQGSFRFAGERNVAAVVLG